MVLEPPLLLPAWLLLFLKAVVGVAVDKSEGRERERERLVGDTEVGGLLLLLPVLLLVLVLVL